jgi:hypothetical protein
MNCDEIIIIKNSHIDRDFRLRYFNLLDYTETGFIGGHTLVSSRQHQTI